MDFPGVPRPRGRRPYKRSAGIARPPFDWGLLDAAFAAAHLGLWRLDLVTGRLECTPQCKANFGLPADAPFDYDALLGTIHPDDRPAIERAVRAALDQDATDRAEYRVVWPDGSLHWLLVSGRAIRAGHDTARTMAGTAMDITAIREADAERERLLTTLTHDLKTPLTSIKGRIQLARRRLRAGAGALVATLPDDLALIEQASDRMERIVFESLDTARIRLGQPLDLIHTPTDIVAVARRVVETHTARPPGRTIAVRTERAELHGPWDARRLEWLIASLVVNAITFSDPDTRIDLTIRTENDETAVLTVRDRGIGIPPAELPHVFERYYRASNARGYTRGPGIGLTGAKQIAEQHGGTIAIAPAESGGTHVTVRLPRRRRETAK